MNRMASILVLGGVAFLTGLVGCKTEVNTPPSQTVIREDRPAVIHEHDRTPDRVNVNVHDNTPEKPSVQNNIKVDR